MSNDFFEDSNGNSWWADIDAITIMLRMWSQAQAFVDETTVAHHNGLRELNFNQAGFRAARNRYHEAEMGRVSQNIYTAPERVVTQLIGRYQDIPRLEEARRRQTRSVLTHNSQTINNRVLVAQRTVTALTFTRDISAAIFMVCIPASGLGVGTAMLARVAGSVFQGVASYQDTGNAVAAISTAVLSFKSSLMILPQTAGRAAQLIFAIVPTGSAAVGATTIRMMTVAPGSTSTFTSVLSEQLITAGLGVATGPALNAINNRLSGQVLPVMASVVGDQANSSLGTQITEALRSSPDQESTSTSVGGANTGARVQQELDNRSRATDEAAWRSTPFYRYLATGNQNELLSPVQQYVMGHLLRRG